MTLKKIIFVITFFAADYCFPQELSFEKISVEHGLSQSTVYSILQDKAGFMWLGTPGGLDMFDGNRFLNFTHSSLDSNSLSDNNVRIVFEDNYQRLWVGTENGLNLFALRKNSEEQIEETFFHFKNNPGDSLSICGNDIRVIFQDKKNNIWIGTSKGLDKIIFPQNNNLFKKPALKFLHYKISPKSDFISSITEDKYDNLWIGTMGNGLFKFIPNDNKFINFNLISEINLSSNFILSLYPDKVGNLWIGTYGGGLNKYDSKENKLVIYKNDPDNKNTISDNKIYSICEDKNGNLWAGTFGGGLNKFIPSVGKFYYYKNNSLNNNSIGNDFIRTIFVDQSEILWIGTNNGAYKTDLKPLKFFTYRKNPTARQSLSDNYILSFFEDKNENLWVGSNEGLDKINLKTGEIKNFKIPHNSPKSESGFVYSIAEGENNSVWLGTFGGGLYKFNYDGKYFQYKHNPTDAKSIIDNRVTYVFNYSEKYLLIGTVIGITKFNKIKKNFEKKIFTSIDSTSLSGRWINTIIKDLEKNIWVGTEQGLFIINEKKCLHLKNEIDNNNSLSSNIINSIYQDNSGIFWIGTENGLNKYDYKTGKFIHYYKKDGLPGNIISNIVGDNENNLWISSTKGITRFNISSGAFRNFDIEDGLQGLEYNSRAAFINKKGDIYFGGVNGFNKFNPAALKDNSYPPPVAITAFSKFDKLYKSFFELSQLEEIVIAYNDRFISFEFAALDFTNPNKNKYTYKLEGFDEDWVYAGNRRYASYTNLDPGEYIFHVKGSNNDGIWNDRGTSIALIVTPPFWMTWWAYFFYGTFFIIAFYSYRKYEINQREKKEAENLRLAKEEAELTEAKLKAEAAELQAKAVESKKEIEKQQMRNRIAADLHDEIGSNLSSIILLSSIIKKENNHNNENEKYIDDINQAAKISAEGIRDIIWFINPLSDHLDNLLIKMKETANKMLYGIEIIFKVEKGKNFEKMNPDVKRNIYLIFKEILNNIIKHSKASAVEIKVFENSGNLVISITDNGIGFNKNIASSGNGISNMINRAKELKGSIFFKTENGKGTEVTLSIKIT